MPSSGSSRRRIPIDVILGATAIVWGVNYSVIKVAIAEIAPLAFNGLRFSLALLTVLAVTRVRAGTLRLTSQTPWRLILLGLLGNTVYQIVFINGIAYTSASNASLIMASTPIFVAMLSRALGKERLTARRWLGVALTVGGILALLSSRPTGGFAGGHLTGDLIILLGAVVWAIYSVAATDALRPAPIAGTLITFLAGAPPIILLSIPSLLRQDWAAVSVKGWLGVLFSGVVAIGLGYLGWNAGLSSVGGTSTAVYSSLNPLVAASVAWVVLGERWTATQLAGAIVALVGITLARFRVGEPASSTS